MSPSSHLVLVIGKKEIGEGTVLHNDILVERLRLIEILDAVLPFRVCLADDVVSMGIAKAWLSSRVNWEDLFQPRLTRAASDPSVQVCLCLLPATLLHMSGVEVVLAPLCL